MKASVRKKLVDPLSKRLRRDHREINLLMRTVKNPKCPSTCRRAASKKLTDLTTDARVIVAIRRRMLARLK